MLARIEDLSDDEDKPDSLLDHYGLIPALDELVQRYVVLPSGGFIVIQETSALIAIDVNSGSDRSQHNANIEAADEIARQLRIRNLGGTIIVDFINEAGKAQKAKLLDRMKKAAETDPCTINIHGWTKLNLIEISRQRRTPTLLDRLRMLNLVEEQETHL